jgi:hypothetical protein
MIHERGFREQVVDTVFRKFLPGGEVMQSKSPAQVYALVFGVTLVAAGIIGFFYTASFDTGNGIERDAVLGILDVNGWHNIVHILTGVLGLLVVASYGASRGYAFGLGAVYIAVALAGFIAGSGNELINLIPVNTEDNVLHLLIGIAGIGAGLATPAGETPAEAAPAYR